MSNNAPPEWFREIIKQGLARIYVQGLEHTPSAEVIKMVRENWVEDLWEIKSWDETLDSERINQAFAALRRTATRWVQIADFLSVLQPRPKVNPPPPIALLEKQKVELTGEALRAKNMGLAAYFREQMAIAEANKQRRAAEIKAAKKAAWERKQAEVDKLISEANKIYSEGK